MAKAVEVTSRSYVWTDKMTLGAFWSRLHVCREVGRGVCVCVCVCVAILHSPPLLRWRCPIMADHRFTFKVVAPNPKCYYAFRDNLSKLPLSGEIF